MHREGLAYVLEILKIKVISRYHNDLLVRHFGIENTQELVARKYYWPTFRADIEAYIKGCDTSLASKAVKHKAYGDR